MLGSGERLEGTVKFFNPTKGWGFVVSNSFEGDDGPVHNIKPAGEAHPAAVEKLK